jgi:ABC-type protease/lipase transport system fused ATPase/permease subunit
MLNRLSLTKLCLLTIVCLLLVALPVYAQESTAEPTAEATSEATVEVAPAAEATVETTVESVLTSEATVEAVTAAEATAEATVVPEAESTSTEGETSGQETLIRLVMIVFGLGAVFAVGGTALMRTRQGQGDLD